MEFCKVLEGKRGMLKRKHRRRKSVKKSFLKENEIKSLLFKTLPIKQKMPQYLQHQASHILINFKRTEQNETKKIPQQNLKR